MSYLFILRIEIHLKLFLGYHFSRLLAFGCILLSRSQGQLTANTSGIVYTM